MTEKQLSAIVRGIMPVIRAQVAEAVARVSVLEQRQAFSKDWHDQLQSTLGDLRDRVVTVEAKGALPALPLHTGTGLDDLRDLRDRLVALETKAAGPSVSDMGVAELRTQLATVQATVCAVSERVAVVEARPLLPGPPGEPGPAGQDGINGKDGAAGLSFEGVYQDGKQYEPGQLATWAGSSWHCNEPTASKPGDGSKAWTLMVKRGRDGKDGHDGVPGAPGRDLTKEAATWRSSP